MWREVSLSRWQKFESAKQPSYSNSFEVSVHYTQVECIPGGSHKHTSCSRLKSMIRVYYPHIHNIIQQKQPKAASTREVSFPTISSPFPSITILTHSSLHPRPGHSIPATDPSPRCSPRTTCGDILTIPTPTARAASEGTYQKPNPHQQPPPTTKARRYPKPPLPAHDLTTTIMVFCQCVKNIKPHHHQV